MDEQKVSRRGAAAAEGCWHSRRRTPQEHPPVLTHPCCPCPAAALCAAPAAQRALFSVHETQAFWAVPTGSVQRVDYARLDRRVPLPALSCVPLLLCCRQLPPAAADASAAARLCTCKHLTMPLLPLLLCREPSDVQLNVMPGDEGEPLVKASSRRAGRSSPACRRSGWRSAAWPSAATSHAPPSRRRCCACLPPLPPCFPP